MEGLVSLVVSVIVVGLVVGLLLWAVSSLPFIPPPMVQIIRVFVIVIACLWLIGLLFGHSGFGYFGHGMGTHIN